MMKKPLRTRRWAALFTGISLAGAAISFFAASASDRDVQIAAAAVLLLVIGGAVTADALMGRFRLSNVKYFILFAFALFLSGGMIVDAQRFDFTINPAAILFTFAALICLLCGFAVSTRGSSPRRSNMHPTFPLTGQQMFALTLIFFGLGFFFVFLEWHLYGQLQSYAGTFTAAGATPQRVMPYVQTFTQFLMPAVILTFIQLRRGTALFRRAVLLFLLAGAVAWYLVWGARGNFLWIAIAFVLVWVEISRERGKKQLEFKPAVVVALSFCAILTLGVVRTTWDIRRAEAAGLEGVWEQARHSLDTYHQLVRTLGYFPARAGYLYGYSFYGVVANPFPRSLWPSKPIGVGKLASILYDGNPANSIGLSLPGELFANFGYAGALLGMFLFGVLAARIDFWYLNQRGDPAALTVYLMALACLMTEIRGDILDATAPALYTLLPTVVCFAIVAATNKRCSSGIPRTARARSVA